MVKELHTDLESVMRTLFRAAGGFGKGVTLGSDYACRAATLWYDGQHERLKESVPEWARQIKQALRARPAAPAPAIKEDVEDSPVATVETRFHEVPSSDHAEVPVCRIHLAEGAEAVPFICRATSEATVNAPCHQSALAQFLKSLNDHLTSVTVQKKEE